MKAIKYYTKQVCFQEVPDEISYTYFISGCPNRCPDCHSKHLWEDTGLSVADTFVSDLASKAKLCTCILFMGGDDPERIEELKFYLNAAKLKGFKTALYTGRTLDQIEYGLIKLLDYIKVGPYDKTLGGLKSENTNQRLYRLDKGCVVEDLTSLFRRTLDDYQN